MSSRFDWSPAGFHRERARSASPWAVCRACGKQRRHHGIDGRDFMDSRPGHWFVPPKDDPGHVATCDPAFQPELVT